MRDLIKDTLLREEKSSAPCGDQTHDLKSLSPQVRGLPLYGNYKFDLLIDDHDFGVDDARVSLVDQLPDVDEPRFDVSRPQLLEVGGGVAGVVHELDVVADPHHHVPVKQS